jgi:hypothetical protein
MGMQPSGHSRCSSVPELGFELWIGDPAEIRTNIARKQKIDRQDAQLLLQLLLEKGFPRVWVRTDPPSAATALALASTGSDARA